MNTRKRVIPVLLFNSNGLTKGIRFSNYKYIGDPVNAIRIFNEKEVDEIIILDISATKEGREPNYSLIEEMASESFMPLCYGGGVTNVEQIKRIINLGVEKVSLNSILFKRFDFLNEASEMFGESSIVASIDLKTGFLGKLGIYQHVNRKVISFKHQEFIANVVMAGAGELLIQDVSREGTMAGFNCEMINMISNRVNVPSVFSGGAGNLEHMKMAINSGASAVAAGSMFIYKGKNRGILINYPKVDEITNL